MLKYIVFALLCFQTTCYALNFPSIFAKDREEKSYSSLDDYLQKEFNMSQQDIYCKKKVIGHGAEKIVEKVDFYRKRDNLHLGTLKVANLYNMQGIINNFDQCDMDNPHQVAKEQLPGIVNNTIAHYKRNYMFRDDVFVPYYWAEGMQAWGKYVVTDNLFGRTGGENRKGWVWFNTFVFFSQVSFTMDEDYTYSILNGISVDSNFGNLMHNPYHTSERDMFYVVDIPLTRIGDFMNKRFDLFISMLDYSVEIKSNTQRRGLHRTPNNLETLLKTVPKRKFDIQDVYTCIDAMLYAIQKYSVKDVLKILMIAEKDSIKYFKGNLFANILHSALLSYAKFAPDDDLRLSYAMLYAA